MCLSEFIALKMSITSEETDLSVTDRSLLYAFVSKSSQQISHYYPHYLEFVMSPI